MDNHLEIETVPNGTVAFDHSTSKMKAKWNCPKEKGCSCFNKEWCETWSGPGYGHDIMYEGFKLFVSHERD